MYTPGIIERCQILAGSARSRALNGFSDVDGYKNPRALVRHLDKASANDQVRHSKLRLINEFLKPCKGDRILDVGCGAGHDAKTLAGLIGRNGRVVGIDCSSIMIREARRRTRLLCLPVEFRIGDAHHLDFPDNTFDGCLVASTFMHLDRPQLALSEIVRVMKPGARVAALEPDWDTIVLATGNAPADAMMVKIIRRSVRHSGIGHRLPVYFQKMGLASVSVQAGTWVMTDFGRANEVWRITENVAHAHRAGLLSSKEVATLTKSFMVSAKTGMFFGSSTGFAVVGTKPHNQEVMYGKKIVHEN